MKKRILSTVVYIINLILLCSPWIPMEQERYNYFSFSMMAWSKAFEQRILDAGIPTDNITNLIFGARAELLFLGISIVLSIVYLILMVSGKYWKLNFVNVGGLLCVLIMHCSWETLSNFCNSDFLGAFVPAFLFLSSLVECIFRYIIMDWDKIKTEVRSNKEREAALKAEEKERLEFQGKYSKMFYRILLRNFWTNCKDFVLLLFCNVILFAFFVTGLGLKQFLAVENTSKGTLVFNGLNQILVNAMLPMVIISVIMIIILLFYYLKCRAKGYGLFMTLGMRKGLFYVFIAVELIFCLILSMILGSVAGKLLLNGMLGNSKQLIGIELSESNIGVVPYIQTIGIMLGVYLISLMAAREIFVDFSIGKATDLRAIAEAIPARFRNKILSVSVVSIVFCMARYSKRCNFENKYLIMVFFIGLFIVIRYGLVKLLLKERRNNSYLKKLMLHHQLLHKSKTSTGYIFVLTIIQFCIVFYFSFHVFSALIADKPEALFPYDFVCLADETDDEYLNRMKENYDVEMHEFPMVRVSSYDATEQNESVIYQGNPIQGQHIGISESTYHALKKLQNDAYVKIDLGLSEDGEDIYIVYQQDQSVKAQPTAFWAPRKKPLLHIGLPCSGVNITSLHQIDIGYRNYEVKGEEAGSLTGVFKQGTRENLIVFSDEYFEEIKELWKTANIITGEYIENETDRIENLTIYQGVTKLVLVNVDEKDISHISEEMTDFETRHLQKEAEAYVISGGVYDTSISYCYTKEEAVKNISTERYMKIIMNTLVIGIFAFMYLMLLVIKMLSEKEMNCQKLSFLTCMGMRKKDRINLIRQELFYYYYCLPTGMAILFGGVFTGIVFRARLYSIIDMKKYLCYYVPAVIMYLIFVTIGIWCVVSFYACFIERRKEDSKTL